MLVSVVASEISGKGFIEPPVASVAMHFHFHVAPGKRKNQRKQNHPWAPLLSAEQTSFHLPIPSKGAASSTPILQLREVTLREVKELAQTGTYPARAMFLPC